MKPPLLFCFLFLFASCATIVSSSRYPVLVSTSPNGAKVTIKNADGELVHEGQSPLTYRLKAGAGYFKKAYYTVTVELPGYEARTVPVRFDFDNMYWGNALFGGVVGMFVIDPLTGAMYKLKDEYVHVVLRRPEGNADSGLLKIYEMNDIPEEWRPGLVRVQ